MIKTHVNSIIAKVRGNDYKNEYLEIKRTIDTHKLLEFKKNHLKKLLLHAYKHVPYYHRTLKNVGVIQNDKVDLSNFCKIPVLTKGMLRNQEIISDDYLTRRWYYNYSGGSTGEPTKFIQDNYYKKWKNATSMYYYNDMIGIDEKNIKKVILWGSERDTFKGSIGLKGKIGTWLTNTLLLNSFKMAEDDMEKYATIINSYEPDLIRGYAGSLYELSQYAERKNIEIHTPRVIVSSAETLTEEMRVKIEDIFGTKLHDFYGSRETASLAGECKCGLMHIFEFNNYIEVLDPQNEPVGEGKEGRIIVTNLHNFSMPFVRYELGDTAVCGPKKCRCGNVLPTLKKINGRIEEQFTKKDGSIVIGYFFVHLMGVVLNKGLIDKFQVIQKEYDKIEIRVIADGILPEVERKNVENKIKLQMGKDCKIMWSYVNDIPKTRSGKYFYTKSLVAR
ncbi:MAG: hypothetical protein K8R68_06880 [Bacteroidales bacterium]|nr:hypothetical protein [Bacteroidales bacterium]